jgi:hypothetical protein
VGWVKVLFGPAKGSLGDGVVQARLPNSCFHPTRLPSAVSLGLVALLSAAGAHSGRFVVRRSAEAER